MTIYDKTTLSDGDYTLSDGCGWFKAGGFAVRIKLDDEGIAVDIYADRYEDQDAIASAYAFDSEIEDVKLDAGCACDDRNCSHHCNPDDEE